MPGLLGPLGPKRKRDGDTSLFIIKDASEEKDKKLPKKSLDVTKKTFKPEDIEKNGTDRSLRELTTNGARTDSKISSESQTHRSEAKDRALQDLDTNKDIRQLRKWNSSEQAKQNSSEFETYDNRATDQQPRGQRKLNDDKLSEKMIEAIQINRNAKRVFADQMQEAAEKLEKSLEESRSSSLDQAIARDQDAKHKIQSLQDIDKDIAKDRGLKRRRLR